MYKRLRAFNKNNFWTDTHTPTQSIGSNRITLHVYIYIHVGTMIKTDNDGQLIPIGRLTFKCKAIITRTHTRTRI